MRNKHLFLIGLIPIFMISCVSRKKMEAEEKKYNAWKGTESQNKDHYTSSARSVF